MYRETVVLEEMFHGGKSSKPCVRNKWEKSL